GQGGACTNSTRSDPSQLTKPATQHDCEVPVSNSDAVCNGTAPAGYSACIVSAGNLTCPSPFTRAVYHVEDDITLNCPPCSGCAVSTTCSSGTVNLYSDANCATSVGSVPANGTCVSISSSEIAVGSISYAAASNTSCTAGSSTATATLIGSRTICCR